MSGAAAAEGDRIRLEPGWKARIGDYLQREDMQALSAFLRERTQKARIFPPLPQVFAALDATPFDKVKVVVLGQDPYHGAGQAHGLCFSVQPGTDVPPSLVNIFKELRDDLGCKVPNNGYLFPWAGQGVLLLNTVLTVRAHSPASHKGKGWEKFTDAVLHKVGEKEDRVVFVLWGAHAQKKKKLITSDNHVVIESAHPSPLSAKNGFFGSRPFSKVNAALRAAGKPEVDWQLPDL